jgi:hypothetical protein
MERKRSFDWVGFGWLSLTLLSITTYAGVLLLAFVT